VAPQALRMRYDIDKGGVMNKVGGWVGALGLMPLAAHALGGEGLVGGVLFSLGLLLVVVLGGLWGLWGLFWRSKWRWLLGSLAGALAGTVWLSLQICRPGVYGQTCLSVGGSGEGVAGALDLLLVAFVLFLLALALGSRLVLAFIGAGKSGTHGEASDSPTGH